jgi:ParB family chromosome partitioning protein
MPRKLVTRASAEQAAKPREAREKSRDIARLEEELSDLLATQVNIKTGARNKGPVDHQFNDLDALDGVIARLRGDAQES